MALPLPPWKCDLSTAIPLEDTPAAWVNLPGLAHSQFREELCALLQIGEGTQLGERILRSTEWVICRSDAEHDAGVGLTKDHSLLVDVGYARCLSFCRVAPGTLRPVTEYPNNLHRLLQRFGWLWIERFHGSILLPAGVDEAKDEIVLRTTASGASDDCCPFYVHTSGDYDCWVRVDQSKIVRFDHETGEMRPISTTGFAGWLERCLTED